VPAGCGAERPRTSRRANLAFAGTHNHLRNCRQQGPSPGL